VWKCSAWKWADPGPKPYLTVEEEEELASHLASKVLDMVKLTDKDVLSIICAAKENI